MLLKFKKTVALLLAACTIMLGGSAVVGASGEAPSASPAASPTPSATQHAYDVELTVFLYDKCGGCGVDSPGCGNCQDIVLYHGIIKGQLGNRLYDGTILYRMLNCRLEANDHSYDAFSKAYSVPDALYGTLPTVFLGTEESGVYLAGEKMLDYVGEYLDKYLVSTDLAALQAEIDAKHEELYAEE